MKNRVSLGLFLINKDTKNLEVVSLHLMWYVLTDGKVRLKGYLSTTDGWRCLCATSSSDRNRWDPGVWLSTSTERWCYHTGSYVGRGKISLKVNPVFSVKSLVQIIIRLED